MYTIAFVLISFRKQKIKSIDHLLELYAPHQSQNLQMLEWGNFVQKCRRSKHLPLSFDSARFQNKNIMNEEPSVIKLNVPKCANRKKWNVMNID